jgi:hypothetical protein
LFSTLPVYHLVVRAWITCVCAALTLKVGIFILHVKDYRFLLRFRVGNELLAVFVLFLKNVYLRDDTLSSLHFLLAKLECGDAPEGREVKF